MTSGLVFVLAVLAWLRSVQATRADIRAELRDRREVEALYYRLQRERWGVDGPHDFAGRRHRSRIFEPCPGDWLSPPGGTPASRKRRAAEWAPVAATWRDTRPSRRELERRKLARAELMHE